MTAVFGHGRLRLYLLGLLDESPRHGYEIIRLLQDRFLGLYAPSAGTVYPRLAKLEQEGLVAHSVEGGRKVYRITDEGREELNRRRGELEELEAEIRESVYERAKEIRDEVRTSARNLREELRQATREVRKEGPKKPPPADGDIPVTEKPSAPDDEAASDKPWEKPYAAWARTWGPEFSQKVVNLAEGLAQGLAGFSEQRSQEWTEATSRHADDFERLMDRLVEQVRGLGSRHASLSQAQVDAAREVVVRAVRELKDILHNPPEGE